MQAVSTELEAGLTRLRRELELHSILASALTTQHASDPAALRDYATRARRAAYGGVVISSYGLLEQTVDSVLVAAAESLNEIYPTHGQVPQSVRDAHRGVLLTCLRDGARARTRLPVSEQDALTSLATAAGDAPALVSAAFTYSTANYRLPYIAELLGRLDIRAADVPDTDRARELLEGIGFASYDSFFGDLIQRRNDIAHSYADDSSVGLGTLEAYVEVMGCYLRALVEQISGHLLMRLADVRSFQVGDVERVWTGRVGIRLRKNSLAMGDRLLLAKGSKIRQEIVRSLQEDGVAIEAAEGREPGRPISAAVDSSAGVDAGWAAYVIPEEWKRYFLAD